MSYPDRDNPHRRSWANPGPDMTGVVKILAEISANSVTTFKERQEASEKFRKALEEGAKRQEELRLNFPSFSKEQRIKLSEKGYEIYRLDGLTLEKMLDAHHVVRTWEKGLPFEQEVSFKGEVAVNPYKISLWDTYEKTFPEQKKVFLKFKKQIEKEIPGTTAILGKVADFVDLELAYKSRHGRGILDAFYTGGVRTRSRIKGDYFAVLNTDFSNRLGLNVSYFKDSQASDFVSLGEIIVPTKSHWKPKKI